MLAGCGLELAPPEVAGHPAVRRTAAHAGKRPSAVLLDQNLHASALAKLPDGKRRGRPDIVHTTLLVALESPLAKADRLEVALHTRGGELIRIRKGTRPPRDGARFAGLMAKVLAEGRSQDQDPLVWSEGACSPAQALERVGKGPVVRLDEGGVAMDPMGLAGRAEGGELTLVLGAFPSGDFEADWKLAAPETASVWPTSLNAWAVAAEVVAGFRARWP